MTPPVLSVRITIYRLASKAKLVEYLCAAAENGKDVTVLIELRARFDEQNNIDWSERLEEAGCKIIYGFEDYKVHSKICLITRRERGGVRYITQVGTGNYNEKNRPSVYRCFARHLERVHWHGCRAVLQQYGHEQPQRTL